MCLKFAVSLEWWVTTDTLLKVFSKLAIPLTRLTKKNEKFQWSDECEASFQELKRRLVTAPVLALPVSGNEFTIYSDASTQGLGCVLMQEGKVIAYASRQLFFL